MPSEKHLKRAREIGILCVCSSVPCGCIERTAATLEAVEQETETRVKLETAQRCAEIAGLSPWCKSGCMHEECRERRKIEAEIRAEFGIAEGKS